MMTNSLNLLKEQYFNFKLSEIFYELSKFEKEFGTNLKTNLKATLFNFKNLVDKYLVFIKRILYEFF